MMTRFLTAVGAVGLFNEAFTLTVEVMGAKEVSADDIIDGDDDYHHSSLMINDHSSRSYSDCALVAVGDLQKPDGERCADTLCGGQALHNSHDDIYIMMKCMCVCVSVTFLLILPFPCQADVTWSGIRSLLLHQPALSSLSEQEQRFIILFFINHYTCSIKVIMMEDCQDYDD